MAISEISIHSCMITYYIKEQNIFCRYCLQAYSMAEILKRHINDCFKINGKQMIKMPQKR